LRLPEAEEPLGGPQDSPADWHPVEVVVLGCSASTEVPLWRADPGRMCAKRRLSGAPGERNMARGLRCLLGMHLWAKHHREGVAYLQCLRCAKESDGPGPLAGMEGGSG